jgi:hypothetical protein
MHENCHVLAHPIDGKISDEGSDWEDDAFTGRLIDTNEITTDKARAHKFAEVNKPDHSKPPAHATYTAPEEKKAESAVELPRKKT